MMMTMMMLINVFTRILFHCSVAYRTSVTAAAATAASTITLA